MGDNNGNSDKQPVVTTIGESSNYKREGRASKKRERYLRTIAILVEWNNGELDVLHRRGHLMAHSQCPIDA
jgi:hypothetical protein